MPDNTFKYFSRDYILSVLKENNLRIQKRFGQCFMVNAGAVDHMLKSTELEDGDTIVEIGPGFGTLTHRLVQLPNKVIVFELDKGLFQILKKNLGSYQNVELHPGDFLKIGFESLKDKKNIVIISNLPYYISSPILYSIYKSRLDVKSLTITVQREVGERIVAKPMSKSYGVLSILSQYFMDPSIIMKLSSTSFFPPPNVDSCVVYLKRRDNLLDISNLRFFMNLTDALFKQRRKTVLNNLKSFSDIQVLNQDQILSCLKFSRIDTRSRAETLCLEKIIDLSHNLEMKINSEDSIP